MEFKEINPPRKFQVGKNSSISLSHVANIRLSDNEVVTFLTERGQEYDITAKSWGFYATPSLNSRLLLSEFASCLAKGPNGNLYIHIVSRDKLESYELYCNVEQLEILYWFAR